MRNVERLTDKQASRRGPLTWANSRQVPEVALEVARAAAAPRLRVHVHIMPGPVHHGGRIGPKACYYTFGRLSPFLISSKAMTCGFTSVIKDVWPRTAEPGTTG
jgi:hypothetical protein